MPPGARFDDPGFDQMRPRHCPRWGAGILRKVSGALNGRDDIMTFVPAEMKEPFAMAGHALEFTDENFQREVLDSDVPVLVDFWAPWCGPCRMIGPTIEELAKENLGTFKIGKVNVDENGETAMAYNVSSIPALMIFKGGKLVQQFMGVQQKPRLQQALDEAKA